MAGSRGEWKKMDTSLWWQLLLILLLIAGNAYFVGAEVAITGARRSKIRQLADLGSKSAQRVQKLHDMGIMQIVAVTDPTQVGFTRSAMIGITVQGDVDAVADKLEKLPEIAYMVVVAGKYDILAECVTEDDHHLLDVVNRQIRSMPGVLSTETFMYLNLRKQTYTWGTR